MQQNLTDILGGNLSSGDGPNLWVPVISKLVPQH